MKLTGKQRSRLEALRLNGIVVPDASPAFLKLHRAGLVSFTALRPTGILIQLTLAGRAAL